MVESELIQWMVNNGFATVVTAYLLVKVLPAINSLEKAVDNNTMILKQLMKLMEGK